MLRERLERLSEDERRVLREELAALSAKAGSNPAQVRRKS
jgi:hypothetical protein